MSKSFRKTPKGGITTAPSEKKDKKIWHGTMRARNRICLVRFLRTEEDVLFPGKRDVSNIWSFSKDGKRYWGGKGTVRLNLKKGHAPKKVFGLKRHNLFGRIVVLDLKDVIKAYRK